jgi:hypothetical protein
MKCAPQHASPDARQNFPGVICVDIVNERVKRNMTEDGGRTQARRQGTNHAQA